MREKKGAITEYRVASEVENGAHMFIYAFCKAKIPVIRIHFAFDAGPYPHPKDMPCRAKSDQARLDCLNYILRAMMELTMSLSFSLSALTALLRETLA